LYQFLFSSEKSILIVVVADEAERADEAEVILRGLGYSNFERYLDGMEKWREVGGQIEIPKGITFKVTILTGFIAIRVWWRSWYLYFQSLF